MHLPRPVLPGLILCALAALPASAGEGLWPLQALPENTLKSEFDFVPDDSWRARLQGASLRLSGGCSAAFVSANGLVLTNHHCVSRCIAQLSGPKNNLLESGFVARSREQEQICPELELNQTLESRDITAELATVSAGLSEAQAATARAAARQVLIDRCQAGRVERRCEVVSLHGGARFEMHSYRRYTDVRLVFAPETAIARFGGTPDSFSFPRYALDMALLRVYDDGQPFAPVAHFAPKLEGARTGELVFVTGYPGSTQRELTVAQLITLRDVILPQRMAYLSELRGLLRQFAAQGDAEERMSRRELLSIENTLKAFRGRHAALSEPGLLEPRLRREEELRARLGRDKVLRQTTAGAWDAIAAAQQTWRELYTEYSMLELMRGYQSDLLSIARHLLRAAEQLKKPDLQRLPEYREDALPQLTQRLFAAAPVARELESLTLGWSLGMLRELLGADHPAVRISLGDADPAELAARLIESSRLDDPALRRKLWDGGLAAVEASDDPLIRLVRALEPMALAVRERYERDILAVVQRNLALIEQARHHLSVGEHYPDARFTLRLSYGRVEGWGEGDSTVTPFTSWGGAIARSSPHEPYRLPTSWLEAEPDIELTTPVNFTTSHDIVGGYSGSPVLNVKGELVGLIFDGNLHSLGGAYAYDGRYNRAVAVHPAIMQKALDKVYAAPALVTELFGKPERP